jgi:hypothetical protein
MAEPYPSPEPDKIGWKGAWRHRGLECAFGWRTVRKRYSGKSEDAVKAIFGAVFAVFAVWIATASDLANEMRAGIALLAAAAFTYAVWEVAKAYYCAPARLFALQEKAAADAERRCAALQGELDALRLASENIDAAIKKLSARHLQGSPRAEAQSPLSVVQITYRIGHLLNGSISMQTVEGHFFNTTLSWDGGERHVAAAHYIDILESEFGLIAAVTYPDTVLPGLLVRGAPQRFVAWNDKGREFFERVRSSPTAHAAGYHAFPAASANRPGGDAS